MAAPATLTPKQTIAEVCGISEKQVDTLVREGVMPKPSARGAHDVPACIHAYVQLLRSDKRMYSTKELAALLKVTEPMIYAHRTAGMPMADKGTWDIQVCVPWLIQRERDKAHKKGAYTDVSGEELAHERLLSAREERLLKQMAREERERTRVKRSECEAGWSALAGIVVAALEALPGRLAQTMAEAQTVLEARRGLFDEARRIRAELALRVQELIDGAREPDTTIGRPGRKPGRPPGSKNVPKPAGRVPASGGATGLRDSPAATGTDG
ncbi:hypothetical protein [uncultured Thiodictyon sp.]|uniref:hypothetical protein n=1 Tax=uncultured Thiodictyon sp. TaxID=1846217 RepID=UPI0026009A90|nr:hypothetical protein [uncultured Thiodictyon sp.]